MLKCAKSKSFHNAFVFPPLYHNFCRSFGTKIVVLGQLSPRKIATQTQSCFYALVIYGKKLRNSHRTCSVGKVFSEILQDSQENKLAGLRHATLWKKRLCHRCFPVNSSNFLYTFFTEHLWVTASRNCVRG